MVGSEESICICVLEGGREEGSEGRREGVRRIGWKGTEGRSDGRIRQIVR